MFMVTTVLSKMSTFQWKAPKEPNGIITSYHLECADGVKVFNQTANGSQTTTTLSELHPYTNYSCSITAHTSVGGGPAANISVTTEQDGIVNPLLLSLIICSPKWTHVCIILHSHLFKIYTNNIAPSGYPKNFSILTSSRSLNISWEPPIPSERNGVIVAYNVTCNSSEESYELRTSEFVQMIHGLVPGTHYTCLVTASTIVGNGPSSVMTVVTKEESELLKL